MRVLIINPSLWIYGGAERVIVQLANWLTDHHHSVSILCYQICDEIKAALKEARIIECNDEKELNYFAHMIADDFDVINIHNEPGYLQLFPRKRNVVWMCNEPPHLHSPEPLPIEKQAVKYFKTVVADQFNKDRLDKLYDIDSKIINYGVDYEFFSQNPNQIEKEKDMTFIQVGWIADTKNQLRTVEIFKKIKDKYPEAKLILAGKPLQQYAMQVMERVGELGLMGDVSLTDFSSREDVRDLYHKSHVAIFPIKSQGGWLSVFEAMSAGLPVFVSEDATCSSILKENKIGKVCKTDDDFVEAITNIDPSYTKDAKWVKENLKWDTFCNKMFEVFNEDNKSV